MHMPRNIYQSRAKYTIRIVIGICDIFFKSCSINLAVFKRYWNKLNNSNIYSQTCTREREREHSLKIRIVRIVRTCTQERGLLDTLFSLLLTSLTCQCSELITHYTRPATFQGQLLTTGKNPHKLGLLLETTPKSTRGRRSRSPRVGHSLVYYRAR